MHRNQATNEPTTARPTLTRRTLLATGGAGSSALAGCGGPDRSGQSSSQRHSPSTATATPPPITALEGIHSVDRTTDDVGDAIQTIHDDVATDGEGIYVPPGEYQQHTPIELSKSISLFSTTDNSHTRGATLYKQGDFVSLTTTFENRSERGGAGHHVAGLKFSGEQVDDSSHGVVFHSVVNASINTERHGGHGCFFENSNDDLHNTNWSEARIRALANEGNGVRIENTSGDVLNINAMRLEIRSAGNGAAGVYDRHGYDNRFYGDSANNDGMGWDIGGRSQFGVIRQEQNEEESRIFAQSSMFYSLTPVPNRFDLSVVPPTTQIQRGAVTHNGSIVGRGGLEVMGEDGVDLGGGDLSNLAEYDDDAKVQPNTLYFDTSDSALEYKDRSGTIHELS
jgi:hypothetical protein